METMNLPQEGMEVEVAVAKDATFKYVWKIAKYGKVQKTKDCFDSSPFDFCINGDRTQWNLSIRYWKGKEGRRLKNPVVLCLNLLESSVREPQQVTVTFQFGIFNLETKQWDTCPRSRTVLNLPKPTEEDILSVGYRDLHILRCHQEETSKTIRISVKINLIATNELEGNSLANDLNRMLTNDDQFTDVIITCSEDKTLKAHKNILSARSPVFNELLQVSTELDLKNLNEDIVKKLLQYIYTDHVDDLESSTSVLLAQAFRLQIQGLKSLCEKHLIDTVSTSNVPSLLLQADQFECEELKKVLLGFCEENVDCIQKNKAWKILELVNPELFTEVCEAGLGSSLSSNMDSLSSDLDDSP